MAKEKNQDQKNANQSKSSHSNEEKTLNFDEIKDMTVGQVVRKQQEIKDGVEEEDSLLDRYIKQHREDIEAEKFDTIVGAEAIVPEELAEAEKELETEEVLAETVAEIAEEPEAEEVPAEMPADIEDHAETVEIAQEPLESDLQIHKVSPKEEVSSVSESVSNLDETSLVDDDFSPEFDVEEGPSTGKKIVIWAGLTTVLVGALAGAFIWMSSTRGGKTTTSSSASSSQTSSSLEDANVKAFEKLYATFFTDSSQTKLKNSEFGNLEKLKEALDKIGSSKAGYKAAKSKYDALEKAIKAIQAINKQFDKPAIVDGELDTTANVKSDAKFDKVTTGLSAVDALLASAIKFGQTQSPASSSAPASSVAAGEAPAQADPAAPASPAPAAEEPTAPAASPTPAETPSTPAGGGSTNPGWVNIGGVTYGMAIPANVTLQRNLSRVPYNQSAIDDVNNEAWVFNPGILEKIIKIAQERGHITGNNYYLEKVNIINGRGYYNLFQPDGTYLFSINCKTGYFVGNAPGNSDDLDF